MNKILPYAGCKAEQMKFISKYIPKHKCYLDLCCGSLSMLLSKEESSTEIANDLNGHLMNLARVIQDDDLSVKLFSRLLRTVYSKELYLECVAEVNFDQNPIYKNLDSAYYYFCMCWMGRNGLAGTTNENNKSFSLRYNSNGGDSAKRFSSAVDSIPNWYYRLRRVTLLNEDMFQLLNKYSDSDDNFIFIDPPYKNKNFKYLYDFSIEEHKALSVELKRFNKTKIMMTYDDSALIRELYKDWIIIVNNKANHRSSNNKKIANEILILNYNQEDIK